MQSSSSFFSSFFKPVVISSSRGCWNEEQDHEKMSKYRFCLPLLQERGRTWSETSAGPKALPPPQEAAANLPPTRIPAGTAPWALSSWGGDPAAPGASQGLGWVVGAGMEGAGAGIEGCGMPWMGDGCQGWMVGAMDGWWEQGWVAEHQGTGTGSRWGHQGHLPPLLQAEAVCQSWGWASPGAGLGAGLPWDPAQQGQRGQSRAQRLP